MIASRFTAVGAIALFAGVASAADPVKPATLAEVRKSIDWLSFPKPDGAVWEETGFAHTKYHVPGAIDPVVDWTRKTMTAAGWVEEKSKYPESQPDKYRSLQFTKGGFLISQFIQFKTQSVEVTWRNAGNVDLRLLPRLEKGEPVASDRAYVYFTTTAKPEAVAEFCRKEFAPLGWRESPVLGAQALAKGDRVEMRFVQNAMECRVGIGKDEKGALGVGYFSAIRDALDPADFAVKTIPTPAGEKEQLDALDVRKLPRLGEVPAKVNTGVRLVYETRSAVDKAVAFYRKAFTEKGWTLVPPFADVYAKGRLHFEKDGFFASVDIDSIRNKTGMVTVAVHNLGNVDTRQLPHPAGAEVPPLRGGAYFIRVPFKPAEIEAYYRKELPKLGWKEKKDNFVLFEQNGVQLKFYIHEPRDGFTQVQVTLPNDR